MTMDRPHPLWTLAQAPSPEPAAMTAPAGTASTDGAAAGMPDGFDLGREGLGGWELALIGAVLVGALAYLARSYGLWGKKRRPGCAGCASGACAVRSPDGGPPSAEGPACCNATAGLAEMESRLGEVPRPSPTPSPSAPAASSPSSWR